jgi:hypothetical protein
MGRVHLAALLRPPLIALAAVAISRRLFATSWWPAV